LGKLPCSGGVEGHFDDYGGSAVESAGRRTEVEHLVYSQIGSVDFPVK
jgi:hypothetical protein